MKGPSEKAIEAAWQVLVDAERLNDTESLRTELRNALDAAYPIIVADLAEALRDKAEAADTAPRLSYKQGYVRGTYEAAAFIEAEDD